MSANENKKPIGFDMELTDEQLKDVAGGEFVLHVKYRCPMCGYTIERDFSDGNVCPFVVVAHTKPSGGSCRFERCNSISISPVEIFS